MYLIVVSFINGDVEYYGPFPNRERASNYGVAIERDIKPARWFVVPLTVPYFSVVKRVEFTSVYEQASRL